MVKHRLYACLAVVALLALASGASAQFTVTPMAQGTITVTASGSAEAAPEWVEVNVTIVGSGASAVSALMMNQDSRERAVNDLTEQGTKPESIKCSAPVISGGGFAQMMRAAQGGDNSVTITSTLTVRIEAFDPDTVYEDLCNIIDTAAGGGAGAEAPTGIAQMMSAENRVKFGVNDTKPLREKAVLNALEEAATMAALVAKSSGRKLGKLVGVQTTGGDNPMMAAMTMLQSPAASDKAVESVTITVSYEIE